MKPQLSIIIVNYNTQVLLEACVKQLIDSPYMKEKAWEIVVIDNASTDGSIDMLNTYEKHISVIKNSKNVGFAKANNQGIQKARADVFLLLNSDTIADPQEINKALQYFLSDPTIGVLTCKVVLPNGDLDPACHRGFPTPWASLTYFMGLEKLFPKSLLFGQYHLGYKTMSETHEIDSPSGAFYMVRAKVVEETGLLDEDYFMYGEDLDWSYRIKQKGWPVVYYPHAYITHIKKQSGRLSLDPTKRRQTERYFYETMKLFYQKHFMKRYPKIVGYVVLAILNMRLGTI